MNYKLSMLSLFSILLFNSTAYAAECAIKADEQVECELIKKMPDQSLQILRVIKTTCEFPEGNRTDCLQVRYCHENGKFENGIGYLAPSLQAYRAYCQSKVKSDLLMSRLNRQAQVKMGCDLKTQATFKLQIAEQNKTCATQFFGRSL